MTAFRDEHEGLRAQIRKLESEVKELRRQLRIARDADVAAMQRKVEAAEAKVSAFEKGGVQRTYMMLGGGIGFFLGVGAGMYLASAWGLA